MTKWVKVFGIAHYPDWLWVSLLIRPCFDFTWYQRQRYANDNHNRRKK